MKYVSVIMFLILGALLGLFLTGCGAAFESRSYQGLQGVQGEDGQDGQNGAQGQQGEQGEQGATGVAGAAGAPATSPVMINLCPSSKKPRYGLCANGQLSAAYAVGGVYFTPLAIGKHTVGSGVNKCVFTVVSGCRLL